jgi:hypothetical protein
MANRTPWAAEPTDEKSPAFRFANAKGSRLTATLRRRGFGRTSLPVGVYSGAQLATTVRMYRAQSWLTTTQNRCRVAPVPGEAARHEQERR